MEFNHNYNLKSNKAEKILKKILEEDRIKTILKELREHHNETFIHSLRVCLLAIDLGIENQIDNEKLRILAYGALLHDIGKKEISPIILKKPDRLEKHERNQIEQHTILAINKIHHFEEGIKSLILSSHEYQKDPYPRKRNNNWTGIERRKKENEDIKQILAVSDGYDALRNNRSYKCSKSKEETKKILCEEYTVNSEYITQIIER